MTDNVVQLKINTTLDIPADTMLRNIADAAPANAFVISWPADGGMPTYHANTKDMPIVLMRLQEFIHKYYNGEFS